jgi:beta-galactosidase/beta-glucuronidase
MTIDATHPSPFLQRPWTSLDGVWGFSLDRTRDWDAPGEPPFDDTILVPFAPETPASGVGATGFVEQCWYRRTLDIDPAADDERVLLHFLGVDRVADVWIDGHHLGRHVGGYRPFTFDITEYVRPDAELVVRATDAAADLSVPRGKQDWQETSHAIWYPRTTGIWKTVWVERVATNRIESLRWTSDVSAMSVTLRAVIAGPLDDRPLHLDVALCVGDRLLVSDRVSVVGRVVERTFPIGDLGFDDRIGLLWWPSRPTLIEADLRLHRDGRQLDQVASYTALRTIEVADGRFLLNGRPYPLRLVLDQGYWPDTGATPPDVDALRRDIELTKMLGFNGARKHQKVEDPRYFALADQLGLLTWVEMPSAYRPGPEAAMALLDEWRDVVANHVNHPSVIAWVPINESWGVPDCARDRSQRALILALSHLTDALDGMRPVSANDGWETVGGSIVGIHDYDQDARVLQDRYGDTDAVDRLLRGCRTDGKAADLDRSPADGRAVVLSEFGGTSLTTDTSGTAFSLGTANWGYDNVDTVDDLLVRYRGLWAAVHASTTLAGACWTQLTDTYQEVNGLLRADRTPKADIDALRAATKGR